MLCNWYTSCTWKGGFHGIIAPTSIGSEHSKDELWKDFRSAAGGYTARQQNCGQLSVYANIPIGTLSLKWLKIAKYKFKSQYIHTHSRIYPFRILNFQQAVIWSILFIRCHTFKDTNKPFWTAKRTHTAMSAYILNMFMVSKFVHIYVFVHKKKWYFILLNQFIAIGVM